MPDRERDHDSYVDMAKLKNGASAVVINTQVRVNEAQLHTAALNKLPELLKIIVEEEMKQLERASSG